MYKKYEKMKEISLENIKFHSSYIIQYDKQSNGFFLCDNHCFIPDHESLSALAKGINNFIEHYNPSDINSYNDGKKDYYKKEFIDKQNRFSEEKQMELEKFRSEYDEYIGKVKITDKIISRYFVDLLIIHKDYINAENVNPPLIIYLFKGDTLIYIGSTKRRLDSAISYYKNFKDFDGYAYAEVPEELLNDVYINALILNPSLEIRPNDILHSNYATFYHIKKRYDIYIPTIKKIVDLYDVPTYNLNFDIAIVEKDRFQAALDSYISRRKSKR